MKYGKLNAIIILFLIGVSYAQKIDTDIYDDPDSDETKFIEIKQSSKKITKIKLEKNPDLNENRKEIEKHTIYKECDVKSGVLALIKSYDKQIIVATPIYAHLTKEKLSTYLSFDSSKLIKEISLQDITKIVQIKKLRSTFCFNIYYALDSVALCAPSIQEMKAWVNSFEAFRKCKTEPQSNIIFSDFNWKSKQNKQIEDKVEAEKIINKELDAIQKIILTSNIEEKKIRRELIAKLKNAQNFESEIKQKETVLKDIIKKEEQAEKEKETKLISIQSKNKELEILKAVKDKIREMKVGFFLFLA
jgi:hypothetical protein